MARKCPSCGNENDDSRLFCSVCGEPLDPDVRLAQSLKKEAKVASRHAAAATEVKTETRKVNSNRYDDDDDYVPQQTAKKESSAAPWIILGVLAVAVVAVVFLLIK